MGDQDWRERDHPRESNGRFEGGKVTLREFLERIFDERWRSHQEQHEAEQQAISLASKLADQNKADANEWRGTLTDRDRAYAKVGNVDALETRLRLIETANDRREATERERLIAESREKQESDRRQARDRQLLGFALGIPALIGAVAGVIALVRG